MSPATEPAEVVVGVVGRAHGVRGEAVIDVRTDEPGRRFAPGSSVHPADGGPALIVQTARDHGGRLLVRFRGHADRAAVERLRGTVLTVAVDPAELPDNPDEYYDRQLIGLRVLDRTGIDVGSVAGVLHLPEQDLLEVDTAAGRRLVPFVRALVPRVDLPAGTISLADVPGLLDDLDDPGSPAAAPPEAG